jgi:hypothetical protein
MGALDSPDAGADDTQVPDTPQPSALDSLQAPGVSPAGREWGENYLKAHPEGIDTRGEAAIFQDYESSAEEARQALRQAREHLAQQRMDPSVLGLRVAQAMLAPSRYGGGIANQLSNAAGAVADWRQQNQQFQQKQETQDEDLAQQLSGVDRQSLQARLALQQLQERNQASMLNTAMKATAQPQKTPVSQLKLQTIDTPDGKQPVIFDPASGAIKPYGKPATPGVASLSDPATQDYLYQYWNDSHALPPGYSRNPAMVNNIMGMIAARTHAEGKTDAEILANSQLLKSQQKAENDFSPGGKLGQALTSTNRVVAHLSDYQDLFNGLNNKDTQLYNAAKNRIGTWLGKEAPTDIEAVAPILGDELTKSIVPGGGGVTERQEFAHNFSTAKSPAQASGAISHYMQFLKDQVDGTKFSYEQLPSKPTDFENRFLTPRTRDVLGYAHPADALTVEQRATLIDMIKQKQQQPQPGTP